MYLWASIDLLHEDHIGFHCFERSTDAAKSAWPQPLPLCFPNTVTQMSWGCGEHLKLGEAPTGALLPPTPLSLT